MDTGIGCCIVSVIGYIRTAVVLLEFNPRVNWFLWLCLMNNGKREIYEADTLPIATVYTNISGCL